MRVTITGSNTAIEQILNGRDLPGITPHDQNGRRWIEADWNEKEIRKHKDLLLVKDCKLHLH